MHEFAVLAVFPARDAVWSCEQDVEFGCELWEVDELRLIFRVEWVEASVMLDKRVQSDHELGGV